MTEDLGTTSWTFHPEPEPIRAERYYGADGEVAAKVEAHPKELDCAWLASVYCPNGTLLATCGVRASGDAGLGLAIAFCDVALGHEPHKVYRVETTPPKYVRARAGSEAAADARQAGTKRGPPFTPAVHKANTREIRALLQRETLGGST